MRQRRKVPAGTRGSRQAEDERDLALGFRLGAFLRTDAGFGAYGAIQGPVAAGCLGDELEGPRQVVGDAVPLPSVRSGRHDKPPLEERLTVGGVARWQGGGELSARGRLRLVDDKGIRIVNEIQDWAPRTGKKERKGTVVALA